MLIRRKTRPPRRSPRWVRPARYTFDVLEYAVALYDWEENDGDPRVSCQHCDRYGQNASGEAFWVYLPRRRAESIDLDPDVYYGDVICYITDSDGLPICKSPYLLSKIGDLKWIKASEKIPTGWRECNGEDGAWDAKGRVLRARDPEGEANEQDPGDTGGFTWHGKTENNHDDHDPPDDPVDHNLDGMTTLVVWVGANNWEHNGPYNNGYDTDNRSRFKVTILIERYK